MVLVGDDKPEYLPLNTTVICPKKLVKRQLLRMRPDLSVYQLDEFIDLNNIHDVDDEFDNGKDLELLENMRIDGLIDGYVISRGQFSQIKTRVRRHTLGMQRENPRKFERSKFISPPLEGFTVLVSRDGFPTSAIKSLNDEAAETCYDIENSIFESLLIA